MIVQFVLMIAVIVSAVIWRGGGWGSGVIFVGTGLMVLGALFGLAGVSALGRNRTPFPQPQADSQLIQHGLYARLRHPLYTSVMLTAFAWALLWQSWPALIPALALVPFFHAKARREERWLLEKFPGYAEYAQRVPRFLPHGKVRLNQVCNLRPDGGSVKNRRP